MLKLDLLREAIHCFLRRKKCHECSCMYLSLPMSSFNLKFSVEKGVILFIDVFIQLTA